MLDPTSHAAVRPRRFAFAALLLALGLLWLAVGCGVRSDVVIEGFDTPERALAEYLAEQVEAARALPESGALRGRLAMAYHANGLR